MTSFLCCFSSKKTKQKKNGRRASTRKTSSLISAGSLLVTGQSERALAQIQELFTVSDTVLVGS